MQSVSVLQGLEPLSVSLSRHLGRRRQSCRWYSVGHMDCPSTSTFKKMYDSLAEVNGRGFVADRPPCSVSKSQLPHGLRRGPYRDPGWPKMASWAHRFWGTDRWRRNLRLTAWGHGCLHSLKGPKDPGKHQLVSIAKLETLPLNLM